MYFHVYFQVLLLVSFFVAIVWMFAALEKVERERFSCQGRELFNLRSHTYPNRRVDDPLHPDQTRVKHLKTCVAWPVNCVN